MCTIIIFYLIIEFYTTYNHNNSRKISIKNTDVLIYEIRMLLFFWYSHRQ